MAQPGAHNEQVGPEPTGRLLNMAARDEAGETDSHEPETLDEIFRTVLALVVSGTAARSRSSLETE